MFASERSGSSTIETQGKSPSVGRGRRAQSRPRNRPPPPFGAGQAIGGQTMTDDAVEKIRGMSWTRNNRIIGVDFLNRTCAFDTHCESILLRDPRKSFFDSIEKGRSGVVNTVIISSNYCQDIIELLCVKSPSGACPRSSVHEARDSALRLLEV